MAVARKAYDITGRIYDDTVAKYFKRAQQEIVSWNYSYDEALGIVNIEYGYNPVTGKWDGTYKPE